MIPFDDDDARAVAAWLDRSTAPTVRAVRIPCTDEGEWLAARTNGIGASEVGVIIGVSSWTSPYALWWRKKLDWRLPRTEGQRWGHLVEDPIATLFAEVVAGEAYVAQPLGAPYSLWCHPTAVWMLCTPDRLAVLKDGTVVPVELKSDEGGKGWGAPGTDEVPAHHRAQASWQAYIFGAPGAYVVRHRGSGKGRTHVYWVPLNDAYMAGIKAAAGDFLASVALDTPPEPDGAKSTTEALQEINPAIDKDTFAEVPAWLHAEWRQARRDKREAIARDALASNRVRAALGRAEYGTYTTADGLDVIFVKRRIGKRTGYAVAPATTDELREIGAHEQRTEAMGVRPVPDAPSGPPPAQERPGDGDPEGAGVGVGEGTGTDGVDPGGDALDGLVLPPELAELAERARREDPTEETR